MKLKHNLSKTFHQCVHVPVFRVAAKLDLSTNLEVPNSGSKQSLNDLLTHQQELLLLLLN